MQCTQHNQPLPIAVDSHMVGYSTASQSVFFIGGQDVSRDMLDDVYKWDTTSSANWFTDIATPAPTIMESWGAQIVATIDGVIYVVAPLTLAGSPWTDGSAIYRFDTTTEQWLAPIPFTTPLGPWLVEPCVTHNQTHIILVDGYMSGSKRDNDPVYILFYEIARSEWTTHTLITPFSDGTVTYGWYNPYCAYAQNELYIFGGGYDAGSYLNNIYKYDIGNQQFLSIGTLPTTQAYGVAVYDGIDHIYLVGGRQTDSDYLSNIHVFKVSTEELLSEPIHAVFPFSNSVSMILDQYLWIFGGLRDGTPTDIVQKCDIASFLVTTAAPTTDDPTATPSQLPSSQPSQQPSLSSTSMPSLSPSAPPMHYPSVSPSGAPSEHPTTTSAPTPAPSNAPSAITAARPSLIAAVFTNKPSTSVPTSTTATLATSRSTTNDDSSLQQQSPMISRTTWMLMLSMFGAAFVCCLICVASYALWNRNMNKQLQQAVSEPGMAQLQNELSNVVAGDDHDQSDSAVVLRVQLQRPEPEDDDEDVDDEKEKEQIRSGGLANDAQKEFVYDPNKNYKPEGARASILSPGGDHDGGNETMRGGDDEKVMQTRAAVQEESVSSKTSSSDSSVAMHEDHWAVLKVTNFQGIDDAQKLQILERHDNGEQTVEHAVNGSGTKGTNM